MGSKPTHFIRNKNTQSGATTCRYLVERRWSFDMWLRGHVPIRSAAGSGKTVGGQAQPVEFERATACANTLLIVQLAAAPFFKPMSDKDKIQKNKNSVEARAGCAGNASTVGGHRSEGALAGSNHRSSGNCA